MSLLIDDETLFEPPVTSAKLLSLSELLSSGVVTRPGSENPIWLDSVDLLTDGVDSYPVLDGLPSLLPAEIEQRNPCCSGHGIFTSALQQYFSLSSYRQAGEINAPTASTASLRHQYRMSQFCRSLSGDLLDVGCDDPEYSSRLFPGTCRYVGLDPFATSGSFRVIGLAELLPFKSQSFDAVVFNTSLDHVLDHHTALGEAWRVLRPEGRVIVASYAWSSRASLLSDTVHFHHFREFELVGAVDTYFEVQEIKRYVDPKKSDHRYGIYIEAVKRDG